MKFKKNISQVCALIVAFSVVAPASYINASIGDPYLINKIDQGIEVEHLGHGEFSIHLDETSGSYYLTREIHQGIEINILGEGSFSIYVDPSTGDNYLVKGSVQGDEGCLVGLEPLNETIDMQPNDHRHPPGMPNPISTRHNGRTISGHWWGGVDGFTVVARTQSSTPDSQSRASVTPGGSTVQRASWAPNGSTSSISRSVGLGGTNLANWDLESTR